jgi:hypothetical protein
MGFIFNILSCVPLFCEVRISNSMNLTYTFLFCQDSLFRISSIVWTVSVLHYLCWPMIEKQWNLRYCKLWKRNCNFAKWSWKLPHMTNVWGHNTLLIASIIHSHDIYKKNGVIHVGNLHLWSYSSMLSYCIICVSVVAVCSVQFVNSQLPYFYHTL